VNSFNCNQKSRRKWTISYNANGWQINFATRTQLQGETRALTFQTPNKTPGGSKPVAASAAELGIRGRC